MSGQQVEARVGCTAAHHGERFTRASLAVREARRVRSVVKEVDERQNTSRINVFVVSVLIETIVEAVAVVLPVLGQVNFQFELLDDERTITFDLEHVHVTVLLFLARERPLAHNDSDLWGGRKRLLLQQQLLLLLVRLLYAFVGISRHKIGLVMTVHFVL